MVQGMELRNFSRGRHLYSNGRPSCWQSSHILICFFVLASFNVNVGPVSNIWLDPDTGFHPDKPVTCKANGYPRPSFRWLRASDNSTVANEAKLVEKSANYTYICIATNTVNRRNYTVVSAEVNFDAATGISFNCCTQ